MRETKFTVNAAVLIAIIFSGILLFFTISLPDLASNEAVNDYYPIEGTEVSVCYSNRRPNGIYTGGQLTGTLRIEGTFGYDWGAAANGSTLYVNEYSSSRLGMTIVKLDRVDLTSYTKEVLLTDAILRGRLASGELVIVTGFIMPSTFPETNSLMKLYSMSSSAIKRNGATVLFLDPASGETVYSVFDPDALEEGFEERYLSRSLEEIMQ